MQFTEEQLKILKEAESTDSNGKLVRITAGAGTGKTTTLLNLAKKYAVNGQTQITYLTFNRAAAADGKRRLQEVVPGLDARTLHSCAMSLLAEHRKEVYNEEEMEKKILSDDQLQAVLLNLARDEIDDFLTPAFNTIEQMARATSGKKQEEDPSKIQKTIDIRQERARTQVVFFIFKTLSQFCRKSVSLEFFKNRSPNKWEEFKRNYYPAVLFHKASGKGRLAGFSPSEYEKRVGFYADMASQLWDDLRTVRTFDFEMKRAQLLGLAISGKIVLADECQDLDECQIDFLTSQVSKGRQVFFVGDAAQTIYSFRGAKSENLLQQHGRDYQLTTSFRFGPAIAKIANVILFTKEMSPQTTSKKGKKKTWNPYRLNGGGNSSGYVTSAPLQDSEGKLTVIAFANATLLMAAVGMMGMTIGENAPETSTQGASVVATIDDEGEQVVGEGADEMRLDLPKFHINGKGEFSGMSRWKKIVKEIEILYGLYVDPSRRMTLPKANFPEFYGGEVSWSDFTEKVESLELSRYGPTIQVLALFGKRTLEAVDLFRRQVMEKPYTAADADIILSTCHAAKGMEWDRVQVCKDFINIKSVHENGPAPKKSANKRKRGEEERDSSWQFLVKDWGDDLNLLYVACTRAKRVLSIPESMTKFLEECDDLHEFATEESDSESKRFFFSQHVTPAQAKNVELDLIAPLRTELNVRHMNCLLRSSPPPATVTPIKAPASGNGILTEVVKPKAKRDLRDYFK